MITLEIELEEIHLTQFGKNKNGSIQPLIFCKPIGPPTSNKRVIL
jgi:hypothetical protein